jgi:hypothetical protein
MHFFLRKTVFSEFVHLVYCDRQIIIVSMKNIPVLSLKGEIFTNYSGIKQLFRLYHQGRDFSNLTLSIDMYKLEWIDANLSSLFYAILYKLAVENNLRFSTDVSYLKNKFDVLFRNGFFVNEEEVIDERKSTVVLKEFLPGDDKAYISYIEHDLMNHRGMPKFSKEVKQGILNELIEVYTNIGLHARTDHPFFVCGQYYPKQENLIFTIVDLGVGFLTPINEKIPAIDNDFDAIMWALEKSNTTKVGTPGGLGLYQLRKYCENNNSDMQILTGDIFWSSELASTVFDFRKFPQPFVGTTINLIFSQKMC